MFTQTLTRILKIQLVRQFIGAGVGAVAAVTLYSGFTMAHGIVMAHLVDSSDKTELEAVADKAEKFKQIGELAREKMNGVQ